MFIAAFALAVKERFRQPTVDKTAALPQHVDVTAIFWMIVLMPAVFGMIALLVERSRFREEGE